MAGQGTKAKPLVTHLAGGFAMSGICRKKQKIVEPVKLFHSAPRKAGRKQDE
jgi:hypothetical protein